MSGGPPDRAHSRRSMGARSVDGEPSGFDTGRIQPSVEMAEKSATESASTRVKVLT
ncbi:Uncharacterised protein [Nocardia otitidiscaviarum]|uniref:Uncharacterized protein n=1 Tax=Nocardia otitidiscaviarum TaxID=1823 RepID=A0A378YIQ4_9NOCA|nr:Uncharacterised protein [Nocardia otitidiscaviarum]